MTSRHQGLQQLLEKIDALKATIDTFRPLKAELLGTLQEKLRIEWTYNSNAIEGNTLTFGETAFFLREGLTSEGKPLKDYLEAKNHAEAIDGLHEIIKHERPFTEGLMKELHAVLMKNIAYTYAKGADGRLIQKPFHAGQYKIQPNHVLALSGKIHYYTDPLHVKDEMEALLQWFHETKNLHIVEKAAIFHYRFVAIHPFDDGNGRLARILMNLILMQSGYPPCIIHVAHRRKYLEALETIDSKKDYVPFLHFVAQELVESEENIVKILQGKDEILFPGSEKTLHREQREKLILEVLQEGSLSIRQLSEKLLRIKRPTLKSDLKHLVSRGKIKKRGAKKGTVYFL